MWTYGNSIDWQYSQFIYRKADKLKPIDLSHKIDRITINKIDDTIEFQNKKLFQLFVLDTFYKLFEYNNLSKSYIHQDLLDSIFNENKVLDKLITFHLLRSKIEDILFDLKNPIYEQHSELLNRYRHNIEYVILKIICSTPIIYYKSIRESSFDWVIAMLEHVRTGGNNELAYCINNLNSENIINFFVVNAENYYSELQKLKFLLKRTVQLKSNYIIHPTFFKSIKILINTLFTNYDRCEKIKNDSDSLFLEKVIKLFKLKYPHLRSQAFNYIKE